MYSYDLAISVYGPYRQLASILYFVLTGIGLRVFVDEFEQKPITGHDQLIDEVFASSRYALILDTPGYGYSGWTEKEMEFLIDSDRTLVYSPDLTIFEYSSYHGYCYLLNRCINLFRAQTDLLCVIPEYIYNNNMLSYFLRRLKLPDMAWYVTVIRAYIGYHNFPGFLNLNHPWEYYFQNFSSKRFFLRGNILNILARLTAFAESKEFILDQKILNKYEDAHVKFYNTQPSPRDVVAFLYTTTLHIPTCFPSLSFDSANEKLCIEKRRMKRLLETEFSSLVNEHIYCCMLCYIESLYIASGWSPTFQHNSSLLDKISRIHCRYAGETKYDVDSLYNIFNEFRRRVDQIRFDLRHMETIKNSMRTCECPKMLYDWLHSVTWTSR